MLRFKSPPPSACQKSRYVKPLQVPQRGTLWIASPVTRAFFYVTLEFLNKNSANKNRNFTLLSKALGKERPPIFPKTGPLLGISFGVPSKGALPPGSPRRTPTDTLRFQSPPFIPLSKSPVNVPPFRLPIRHVTLILSLAECKVTSSAPQRKFNSSGCVRSTRRIGIRRGGRQLSARNVPMRHVYTCRRTD
jgi:hypothetical protein